MTKYIILFLFLFGKVLAQQNLNILVPLLKGDKYGFSDESGKMIISAKYDQAYPFFPTHELSMAIFHGKAIIINRKGKKVIEASSDYIDDNDINNQQIYKYKPEGIALDEYCLADTCSKLEIFGKPGNTHLIDKIGDLYFVKAQNKVFLIDSKGKKKSKEYDRIRHFVFGEIEYAVSEDHTLNKFGLINDQGEEILECVYDGVNYQGKGGFELKQSGKSYPYKLNYNKEYKPKEIPQKIYDKNRFISRRDGKFGITDSLKNVLLNYEFKKLYPLTLDNYVFWKGDSIGILNIEKGIVILYPLKVKLNGVGSSHDFIPYVPFTDNLAFLNNGEYWILVNTSGQELFNEIEGISVDFQKFAGNIAGICLKGKIGVIDNAGKILIDFKNDNIDFFAENKTFVAQKADSWSWIKADGTIICENIEAFNYVLSNYLLVKKNGKWFFVNSNGKSFVK
jgi:hypothetical protein